MSPIENIRRFQAPVLTNAYISDFRLVLKAGAATVYVSYSYSVFELQRFTGFSTTEKNVTGSFKTFNYNFMNLEIAVRIRPNHLRFYLGNLRLCFINLWSTSVNFGSTSVIFASTSVIFGSTSVICSKFWDSKCW